MIRLTDKAKEYIHPNVLDYFYKNDIWGKDNTEISFGNYNAILSKFFKNEHDYYFRNSLSGKSKGYYEREHFNEEKLENITINIYNQNHFSFSDSEKHPSIIHLVKSKTNIFYVKNFVFYKDKLYHRENGPAVVEFDLLSIDNKEVEFPISEEYLIKHRRHRLDGPALIYSDFRYGSIAEYRLTWFVNGKKIDIEKYPVFKDGKRVNNVLVDNALKLNLMMFDREYFDYVMRMI